MPAGTIDAITNSGLISASTGGTISKNGIIIGNQGTIGSLLNTSTGTITSSESGIYNTSGTIGSLTNNGIISGGLYAIGNVNGASIGSLLNNSQITSSKSGIYNDSATIGSLTNNGTISGSSNNFAAIGNADGASIGSLLNNSSGKIINSAGSGIFNDSATIGSLTNNGTISGSPFAIGNGNGSSIGTITNTGAISGTNNGVYNVGRLDTLTNTGTISGTGVTTISGTVTGTAAAISNAGTITSLNNTVDGTIVGTISGSARGVYNATGTIATLTNSGAIIGTSKAAIWNGDSSNTVATSINVLENTGLLFSNKTGIVNYKNIGTLSNGGTISGGSTGIYTQGSIGGLSNTGTITATIGSAIDNNGGTISTLTNTGTISGVGAGVRNAVSSTITSLTNNFGGTISGTGGNAVLNQGSIGRLDNDGLLDGGNYYGVWLQNNAAVTSLHNQSNGTIIGSYGIQSGIQNPTGGTVSIGTLTNDGLISSRTGVAVGLSSNATIGTLTNTGVINGAGGSTGAAIGNAGTITTLTNTATGTITSAGQAIYNDTSGSIGGIVNSGLIAGSITNLSAHALTIAGGNSVSEMGTLTGFSGGIGSITSSSDVVFSSGYLLLNDNISAAGHTVSDTGANVQVNNALTITGNFNKSGGTLTSKDGGYLVVNGNATINNGTIVVTGSNLAANQTITIVDVTGSGHTGSYSNNTASVLPTNGLTATLSLSATDSNDLVLTLAGNSDNTWTVKGATVGGVAAPVGATLDKIRTGTGATATAFQNDVLARLDTLPSTSQGAAIKQLAPTQNAPTSQMSRAAATAVLGAVEQHQQTAMAYDGPATGMAAGSDARDSAIWGQFLGGGARRGTNAEADGYTLWDFGIATGIDHRFTPNAMAGAALSWVRAWSTGSDGSSGSSSIMDNYQLTLYGTYRLDRAFVDGQLGLGWNEFNQKRAIGFLGRTASAQYSGQQYLAKATVGYDVPVAASVTVTPLASLRWLRSVTEAYDETGAGTADLAVTRRGVNSLSQDLGAKVSWNMPTGFGTVKPEARLAWVHDYTNGPIASSGIMGGEAFAVTTPRTAADGVKIGLAANLNGDDAVSFRVEYEGELRAQYQSHTGLLKTIWGF